MRVFSLAAATAGLRAGLETQAELGEQLRALRDGFHDAGIAGRELKIGVERLADAQRDFQDRINLVQAGLTAKDLGSQGVDLVVRSSSSTPRPTPPATAWDSRLEAAGQGLDLGLKGAKHTSEQEEKLHRRWAEVLEREVGREVKLARLAADDLRRAHEGAASIVRVLAR